VETAFANLITSFGVGILCGLVVSVPIGPLSLTVINTALQKGFRAAFVVGLGGVLGEALYAAIMLAGHSSLVERPHFVTLFRFVALAVMVGVGVRYLFYRPEKLASSAAIADKVEKRWHHPRDFLLGFALTISNLLLIVLWATLVTLLFAHEWVQPSWQSRSACLLGIFAGGTIWFLLLAYFVSRAHRRISAQVLTRLIRSCGVVLLFFSALLAWRLFR